MGPVMYLLASDEYYLPPTSAYDLGRRFRPTSPPPQWPWRDKGLWTHWAAPEGRPISHGWKIHVSASFQRASKVLDVVAEACFSRQVSFKHVSHELFFTLIHHKQARQNQSGKFATIYPEDEDAARSLLEALHTGLRGEAGPFILGDRRYRDSQTVHYRYGAHRERSRVNPDGTQSYILHDANGSMVEDARGSVFRLPAGIDDPFTTAEVSSVRGPLVIAGYEVRLVLQQSNAGAVFQAIDPHTGKKVLIKEARAFNGLINRGEDAVSRLQHEYHALRQIHQISPGACPAPIELISRRDHTFLVTEYIDGISLETWVARYNPATRIAESAQMGDYYVRCLQLMESTEAQFAGIRAAGYSYGDMSPADTLVCGDGQIRLVDFEACTPSDAPPSGLGTPNFEPPTALKESDGFDSHEHALSIIAQQMICPFQPVLQRNPAAVELLERDLPSDGPGRNELWKRATRFLSPGSRPTWQPTPDELETSPEECLQAFSEKLSSAIIANADPANDDSMFPTIPAGYETNTLCLAYGAAGVLHALHCSGADVPQDVTTEFTRRADAAIDHLPASLLFGLAGIGYSLAALGEKEMAHKFLERALEVGIASSDVSLGQGLAGLGLTCLRISELLDEPTWVANATQVAEQILSRNPTHQPGAIGLLDGSSGVALFLDELACVTSDTSYTEFGRQYLRHDFERLVQVSPRRRSVPQGRRNLYPYLGAGTAGVLLASSRYGARDESWADHVSTLLADVQAKCPRRAGLFTGLAGLVLSSADHSRWNGGMQDRQVKQHATTLLKYGIADRAGISVLGEGLVRKSSELWSGAAGVLIAVTFALQQERVSPLLLTPARKRTGDGCDRWARPNRSM